MVVTPTIVFTFIHYCIRNLAVNVDNPGWSNNQERLHRRRHQEFPCFGAGSMYVCISRIVWTSSPICPSLTRICSWRNSSRSLPLLSCAGASGGGCIGSLTWCPSAISALSRSTAQVNPCGRATFVPCSSPRFNLLRTVSSLTPRSLAASAMPTSANVPPPKDLVKT